MESKFNFPWVLALFLLFLGLKLGEVIDWSWWWVTSPLWLPAAIGVIALPFAVAAAFAVARKAASGG